MKTLISFLTLVPLTFTGCYEIYEKRHANHTSNGDSTLKSSLISVDTSATLISNSKKIDNTAEYMNEVKENKIYIRNISADTVVAFARSLMGTPYKYGSADPKQGLDCSGFITAVFSHFNIKVPRSSAGFENSGNNISVNLVKKGDILLFKGTDSTERSIGHMGLVVSNDNGEILFIHSSSGKAYSVIESPLDKYYMGRFLKAIRIFPD